ncbi:REXO2_1 [Sanghuangporus sanghuang]
MPIPLVGTLSQGRVLQRPRYSRPIIDSSGSSYDNHVVLDLETNDAFQPPAKTRILEIAICVTNKNFEPLDAVFSSLVHWPNLTIDQLLHDMPFKCVFRFTIKLQEI